MAPHAALDSALANRLASTLRVADPDRYFTSLFAPVRIYAVPNDGFLYDLGFVTGFTAFLVGVFVATMARIGGMIS